MNQFAGVLTSATAGRGRSAQHREPGRAGGGVQPAQYCPRRCGRGDRRFSRRAAEGGSRYGPDGKEVPAQVSQGKVIFLANVPSVGYAVYDVQAGTRCSESPCRSFRFQNDALENEYYRVKLNADGDVASIFDKKLGKELACVSRTPRHFL